MTGVAAPVVEAHRGVVRGEDLGIAFDLRWAATTHTGRVRKVNQDCYRILGPVFVVCDGMGGHLGGETASAVAADVVVALGVAGKPSESELDQSVAIANDAVLAVAADQPSLTGMGTTIVALAPCEIGGSIVIAGMNVGDSRVYLYENGNTVQLSHDQSVVQELIDRGSITVEEALRHKQRSVLTHVLGMEESPEAVSWRVPPRVGQRFLLCTDGIHRSVDASKLSTELATGSPRTAAERLVAAAFDRGAPDNLALIIVDVVPADSDSGDERTDSTIERLDRMEATT